MELQRRFIKHDYNYKLQANIFVLYFIINVYKYFQQYLILEHRFNNIVYQIMYIKNNLTLRKVNEGKGLKCLKYKTHLEIFFNHNMFTLNVGRTNYIRFKIPKLISIIKFKDF